MRIPAPLSSGRSALRHDAAGAGSDRPHWAARAEDVKNRLVGSTHMQRIGIGVGIDRDGANAELAAGVHDAAGDLAAVGDQDLVEHLIR